MTVQPYTEHHRAQLLDVWERSVLATHDFLSSQHFAEIKAELQVFDFGALDVWCLQDSAGAVAGFTGVATGKIEMLFLAPEAIGHGWGTRLIQFAADILGATRVDVNEQNTHAVAFYKKAGFEPYEHVPKDDAGRPYPLLRMKKST